MSEPLTTLREIEVRIPCTGTELAGDVAIPSQAHGSGSSRKSPCNRFVAGETHRRKPATLLFEWLPGENRLRLISGATHFFEEPAADWFALHLTQT